jgi:hypothetical protein
LGSACVSGITPNVSAAGARRAVFDLAGALVARELVCAFAAVVFARFDLGFTPSISSSSKLSTSSVSLPACMFVRSFNACRFCVLGGALRFGAIVLVRRVVVLLCFAFEVVVVLRLFAVPTPTKSSSLPDAPASSNEWLTFVRDAIKVSALEKVCNTIPNNAR